MKDKKTLLIITMITALIGFFSTYLAGRERGFEEAFRLTTDSPDVKISRHTYMSQVNGR